MSTTHGSYMLVGELHAEHAAVACLAVISPLVALAGHLGLLITAFINKRRSEIISKSADIILLTKLLLSRTRSVDEYIQKQIRIRLDGELIQKQIRVW